jgi:hypothetical protein
MIPKNSVLEYIQFSHLTLNTIIKYLYVELHFFGSQIHDFLDEI